MNPTSRLLALAFVCLAGLSGLVGVLNPELLKNVPRTVADFGIYYSAAKVSQNGGNPFDLAILGTELAKIRPDGNPMPANSGPWAIGAMMPLTLLDFAAARLVWLFLEIAILVACGDVLWKLYGGKESHVPFVWLAVLGGYASVQTLWLGQLNLLVLAAFVLFAQYRDTRPFVAGMGLALLAVKPQNQLLAMFIGSLWMIDRRTGKVFAGIVCGAVVLTLLATIGNFSIFSQYLRLLTDEPPSAYLPPVPGSLLRWWFGRERFSLTFLPLALGTVWGSAYYFRHRANWNWLEQLPLILLISYLASPYGWAYDQLVFLFAFLQMAAWATRQHVRWWLLLLTLQFALTGYYFTMLNRAEEFHWVWLAPMWAVVYCVYSARLG